MFRRALAALGLSILFFVVFTASYSLIGRYFRYDIKINDSAEHSLTDNTDQIQTDNPGVAEETAKQLIFVTDGTGAIINCYISVLRCDTGKLYYIRIPAAAQLAVPEEILSSMGMEAGSITSLFDLYTVFQNSAAYLWGEIILEDILDFSVSYTTIYTSDIFSTLINSDIEAPEDAGAFSSELPVMILEAGGVKAYMTWLYQNSVMNISLQDRLFYLETFENLSQEDVSFQVMPGEMQNGSYVLDTVTAGQQLRQMTGE